jgi:phage-related baseplate assembly protein
VVNVAILSRTGDGVPSSEVLATVVAALNAEVVRPLCDTVQVEAADVVPYVITASLDFYPGTGQAQVMAAAQAAAEAYAAEMNKLGRDITLSGIYAALHQPGVQKVNLTAPLADIVNQWNQAPRCTAVTVTAGVIDD